jgi:hypothetical protein
VLFLHNNLMPCVVPQLLATLCVFCFDDNGVISLAVLLRFVFLFNIPFVSNSGVYCFRFVFSSGQLPLAFTA